MKDYEQNHNNDCHQKKCQKKCDCCCTPGMRRELERLLGRFVFITTTRGSAIFGKLVCVDCDIARVASSSCPPCPAVSSNSSEIRGGDDNSFISLTSISICEIDTVSDDLGLQFGGYDQKLISASERKKSLWNRLFGE